MAYTSMRATSERKRLCSCRPWMDTWNVLNFCWVRELILTSKSWWWWFFVSSPSVWCWCDVRLSSFFFLCLHASIFTFFVFIFVRVFFVSLFTFFSIFLSLFSFCPFLCLYNFPCSLFACFSVCVYSLFACLFVCLYLLVCLLSFCVNSSPHVLTLYF